MTHSAGGIGPDRTERGFTLAEVLLGIGLVALLAGVVFEVMWIQGRQWQSLRRELHRHHAADVWLDRLESDLRVAVAGDTWTGAGIRGGSGHIELLACSVGFSDDQAAARSDLQRAEYRFDARRSAVVGRRWEAWTSPPGLDLVVPGVIRVRFRYYDGSGWRDTFDSLVADALPGAVEIAVWYRRPGQPDADVSHASDDEEDVGTPDRLRVVAIADGVPTESRPEP